MKTMVYHSFLDMQFTVLPEGDRMLLIPHTAAVDGTQLLNSDMPAVTANYRVHGRKMKSVIPKNPMNSEDGGDLAPNKPGNSETTAVTSTRPEFGYRVGGGKVKSVIPKKRKLVKTMMYNCIKDFLRSLFRRSPDSGAPQPPETHYP